MHSLSVSVVVLGLGALACRSERVSPEPFAAEFLAPTAIVAAESSTPPAGHPETLALPPPEVEGGRSVEQVLAARRSHREFAARALSLPELGQLAWATQGVTERARGLRAAPSAGALYPLELYFATAEGLLHYRPGEHVFVRLRADDLRPALARAALDQGSLRQAPCVAVFTAVTARTAVKYRERAARYVAMEAGHAAQNLLLQATARDLAAVPIGAFDDAALAQVLALPAGETPLYLVALGAAPAR